MNRKKIKQINRQVSVILVDWLKTLVSEEEAKKINLNNYKELLPSETHVFANNKYFLSTFSPRWVRKKLKSLVSRNPTRLINTYTLEDIKSEMQTWKMINREF